MVRLFAFAMIAVLVSLAWAAAPQKAPAKKSSSTKSVKSGAKTSSKKTSSRKKASARTTWRNRQMAPTPQRYKEIQEALAAKGFLQPQDATGVWNQTSIDALKRFQSAQNIEATGKINSLSLIALGLGPKRDPLVKPPTPPPAL
jgi:hypothetical protein